MRFHRSLLLGTTALTYAALACAVMLKATPALAACQTVSGADATISSSISCITWDSNNVTITSGGTVAGTNTGILNSNHSVGNLTNSDTIRGNSEGILNNGTIGVITNSINGVISGSTEGIANNGSIGAVTNNGGISGGFSGGIYNSGIIGTITNSGLITTTTKYSVLNESGSIGTITNTGTLSAASGGIGNFTAGTISTITNSGTISSSTSCVTCAAILNSSATIGSLSNSGMISGPTAIKSVGTILSPIANSGTIEGKIDVGQDLTFTDGNASTIGTLTGYSGSIGTITANNLTFDSAAYQFLDDDVNVGSGSGTVTNSGTLMLKATHTITGNYTQGSSALLMIGVIDPTHYGGIVVTGNATMTNDHVSIVPVSGTLSSGESFTIAQDSIAGTANYSGVTATATGFTASISSITSGGYDDLIVALTSGGGGGGGGGTYTPIGAAAGGGVAPSVGAALDQIKAASIAGFTPVFTALDNLGSISQGAEQQGIKQLAPNQVMGQAAAANVLMDQTVQVVGQHQEGLLTPGQAVGKAAGSEYESGIFWAQASGGFAVRDSDADTGGYRQTYYGMTFGVDDHIAKDTTLGLALGWLHSDAGGSGELTGDTVDLNDIQLTGYGTQRFGPAFVDGMLGLGINLYDQKRDIGFLSEQAKATYQGTQYMGRAEGGYDFAADNLFLTPLTLTPMAGITAARTNIDGYSESGAGAADITAGGQGVNSFETGLGGKVAAVVPTSWGEFMPELKLSWLHDLTGNAIATPASLGGVSFTTATPRVAQDGAQVTLGLTLRQSDNIDFKAEYDGDIRSDYASHTGLVKVEWGF